MLTRPKRSAPAPPPPVIQVSKKESIDAGVAAGIGIACAFALVAGALLAYRRMRPAQTLELMALPPPTPQTPPGKGYPAGYLTAHDEEIGGLPTPVRPLLLSGPTGLTENNSPARVHPSP